MSEELGDRQNTTYPSREELKSTGDIRKVKKKRKKES